MFVNVIPMIPRMLFRFENPQAKLALHLQTFSFMELNLVI